MDTLQSISARRSVKVFAPEPVTREQISTLLETVVAAPNHRMTEPWRFVVVGPEARETYASIVADRKAAKCDDEAQAELVRQKAVANATSIPWTIAVIQLLAQDSAVREEDYATVYMGIQNLLLAAVAMGLGTHVKTGGIMDDPRIRTLLGMEGDERIVALVQVGFPEAVPDAKPRTPARLRTSWLP
ncbi:MAG: nitroreductase [Gemmatimonadota bacterium]